MFSLDNSKIKKMIDYALKEPKNPNNLTLNIELINLDSEKSLELEQNGNNINTGNNSSTELIFYKAAYKYPYISSEILSSDLQLILDKLLPLSELLNLEESKSYLLNLSSDSINNTSVKKEEMSDDIILVDEIKKEQNYFLFNPPEIEYGYEKDKEKFEINQMNISKDRDRDISLNTSLDRKFALVNNPDNFEIIDYIFSFIAELNSINSSYFAKIVLSILKSTSKCSLLIKHICFKKPDLLIALLSNLHTRGVCDVIIKLLCIENLNLEDSVTLDNLKLTILNRILAKFSPYCNFSCSEDFSNISYILSEYVESNKSLDLVMNEIFLNNLSLIVTTIKNKQVLKEVLHFCLVLMKQFKVEYEKAFKFVSSISLKSKLLEKTNILSLDNEVLLINKLTNCLDNVLELFKENDNSSTLGTFKITIVEYISTLLTLSRNHSILDKFVQYKFFESCWLYFFSYPNNNIFHNLIEKILNILLEDTNSDENFFEYFLIKSKFIQEIGKFCNTTSDTIYYTFNSGKKIHKGYFIQISKIIQILYNNLNVNPVLKKICSKSEHMCYMEDFVSIYETNFKTYLEKMNHSLGMEKSNFNQQNMNILSMLENNEEFCSKKLDFLMQIQEMNKKLDIIEIGDNNRDFNEDFSDGDFSDNNSNEIENIALNDILVEDQNKFYDNNYWKVESYCLDDNFISMEELL